MSKIGNMIALGVTAGELLVGQPRASVDPSIAAAAESSTPTVIRFDPSQRRMFNDESRVIIVVWHRQKGKDFTAAAKAVQHALKTGQTWFIVSLTQRQADATFDKCKKVAQVLMRMLAIVGTVEEGSYASEQYDKELKQSFSFLAREIRLPGGGRVVSLPGRDPDTLAGLTGNIIFTEFGLFPNGGYDHWRVVFPLTTRGFQCIVISTPRGKNTKFYELFVNDGGVYSVHFCDIHRSIAEDGFILRDNSGNPTDVETFKKLYGDATGFEREYECKFTGDASALITWAELERAAGLHNPNGFRFLRLDDMTGNADVQAFAGSLAGRRIEIGWDVARTGDISAVALNVAASATQPKSLALVIAMHNCEFAYQRSVLMGLMSLSARSVGFGDATGLGMDSNETLHTKYGERWTPFTFTGPGKRDIASALKTAFGDGTQTLPPLDGPYKLVATDVYAIQKDNTGANLVLSETPNPLLEESHCDIAYALGLARLAGSRSVTIGHVTGTGEKPSWA